MPWQSMSCEDADAILENVAQWQGTRTMSAGQFAEIVAAFAVQAGVNVDKLRQTLGDVLWDRSTSGP